MSSCGREGDDEKEMSLLAAPKPGSCCSTKKPSTANGSGSCACSSSSSSDQQSGKSCGGDCACSPTVVNASAPATTTGTATGIVPPKRSTDAKSIGHKPLCYKCHESPSQVNLRDAISCKECFTFLFVARVKSALRLKCTLGKGARVLLGVSGGSSSSCLARTLQIASDPTAGRKLFFEFDTIHVDESGVALGTEKESEAFQDEVIKSYEYLLQPSASAGPSSSSHSPTTPQRKLVVVPLEEVLNLCTEREWSAAQTAGSSNPGSTAGGIIHIPSSNLSSNRTHLRTLFSSLRDSSDKLDLLSFLRSRLLAHMTRVLGYEDLVLATSSSTTAESLFTQVTQGRGAMIASQCASSLRERKWQTNLLYPLREQSRTQVALFCHFMRIPTVYRWTWMNAPKRSAQTGVQGLAKTTHEFLAMLDAKFSSTVSNILGSFQKLVPPPESSIYPGDQVSLTSHCSLCCGLIVAKESEEDLKTRHAGVGRVGVSEQNKKLIDAIPALCYGCIALVREVTDVSLMPTYVLQGVAIDHRSVTVTYNGVASFPSTYPSPFNHLLHTESKLSHDQRREENRKRKEQQMRDQEEGEDGALRNSASASASATHQPHAGLQLQSRQDMKASFAEFVLPEE